MSRLGRQVVLWAISALTTGGLFAQTRTGDGASGVARFEVASIRPHANPDDSSDTNLLPGGRYEGKNVSLRKLIRQATGVDDRQMVGVPDWVDSERYDINAKTADVATLKPEVFQKLLLALLEDRFGFRFHWETREQPVYWMVAQKSGAKLKPHQTSSEPTMSVNGGTRKTLIATGISMDALAGLMTRQAGRPVQDHTGLAGLYDVRLEWDESQSMESGLPSLFGALEEQLGLKLTSAKGTVQVLVVDNVQRPSGN
ncbi:MAG TPA: TIGR03435 family protein [Acidobacteriaceae bacterium]|nr:TIGR03435 family protein [Acidobacteriaceae bacterium]